MESIGCQIELQMASFVTIFCQLFYSSYSPTFLSDSIANTKSDGKVDHSYSSI